MSDPIYKLADRAEWAEARAAGAYNGSAVDRADGYIHMSTTAQLAETARRHYAGREGLVLVALDPAAMGDALRWEASRGGDLFPHLYGPLPMTAVRVERTLAVRDDGAMIFDDGATGWP
ncbi:DUF952 domain-containing protein [Brevundimonas basaltis]|uniref:Uncharacterized protein (DUF952 family) n=1 Tax=Brevundimonas basaltis TaxID=472166 RepID=A0A7W8I044_9CAUL|nr:DUF952 domain-containing protein [Brevundimonas basaltis]MBB5293126.1 uncharacterized protein (DUF952 family) [Brevundimonas basaltis]